jgi:hypothetical protein
LAADLPNAEEIIGQAWERAAQSGAFGFQTEVRQSTLPGPSIFNAGKGLQEDRVFLEGFVDKSESLMEMEVWQNTSQKPANPAALRMQDGQLYQRVGLDQWEPAESSLDLFTPGGDPLGFLAAATNVQQAETEVREFGSGMDGISQSFARYAFDFDGPAFAAYVHQRLEERLLESGDLPAGMSLSSADMYNQTTGTGEVWLDADGLPRRITLNLEFPPQENGDLIRAVVQSEYYDYDRQQLALATSGLRNDPMTWLSFRLSADEQVWRDGAWQAGMWILAAFLLLLALRYRRSGAFHAAVVLTVIVSMLVTPLLQSGQAASFTERQLGRRAEQEALQAEAETVAEGQRALTTSYWDPQQDPFETTEIERQAAAALESGPELPAETGDETFIQNPTSFQLNIAAAAQITTTDTDGDGLSDADETYWLTCAAPADCPGLADSKDSDGDGLTDGEEVNGLNTVPTLVDTDGDGITDTLEILGFTDNNGVHWYLDPNEVDSNKDGLIDGVECDPWADYSANADTSADCPDTDGDGTPDIFDDDNDGDGVQDAVDLSPFSPIQQTYSQANPLKMRVDGLTVNEPTVLQFQIRPIEPRHLAFYGSVFDWPANDNKGQFQRVLSTTFQTTSNPDIQQSGANMNFGDMRVVPMLQINVPYQAGHYANLPVLQSMQGIQRTASMTVGQWLDESKLQPYGISVRDNPAQTDANGNPIIDGNLSIDVPVVLVKDQHGGGDVAFSARMLVWPFQGSNTIVSWGSDYAINLIWYVQLITDQCPGDPPAATCANAQRIETLTPIHIYDDPFTLAGMAVTQDFGLKVGLLYENPASDVDLSKDDQLWLASENLANTFLRGRDCPVFDQATRECDSNFQDGQRDVTVDNVLTQISSWTSGTPNPSYISGRFFTYDHQDMFGNVMITETKKLLDEVFGSYVGQTDPTIMFMQETEQKRLNLDDGVVGSGTLNFTMGAASPKITSAYLSWATYFDADNSATVAWQPYDLPSYLDVLDRRLATLSGFQPVDQTQDSLDVAEGKRRWAMLYYSAMHEGFNAPVELEAELWWSAFEKFDTDGDPADERLYDPVWPDSSFIGTGAVLDQLWDKIKVSRVNLTVVDEESVSKLMTTLLRNPSRKSLAAVVDTLSANKWKTVANGMSLAGTALAVAGTILYISGVANSSAEWQLAVKIMLNVGSGLIVVATAIELLQGLRQVRNFTAAGSALRGSQMSAVSKSNTVFGSLAGFMIGTVIILYLYLEMIVNDPSLAPGNGLLSGIATAILLVQLLVLIIFTLVEVILNLILPGLGTIIFVIIAFVDTLLASAGVSGFQTWFTEWLIEALVDIQVSDYVVNFGNPARLSMSFSNIRLNKPELGWTTANGLLLDASVTNVIEVNSRSKGAESAFRYSLGPAENLHGWRILELGDMTWSSIDTIPHTSTATLSSSPLITQAVRLYNLTVNRNLSLSSPAPFSAPGAGVNQNLGRVLFVNEGFILASEACVEFIGIDIECESTSPSSTINHRVGEGFIFDILPANLTGFLFREWKSRIGFAYHPDFDNDGLLNPIDGGADPNDIAVDEDNDGLYDPFELARGTLTNQADTDGDGLTDFEEETYNTNPLRQDTDGDGLSDYTEIKVGWKVLYGYNGGTPKLAQVWSDPLLRDEDTDGLTDLEEFTFGQHPQVETDPSIINNLIAFDNIRVDEATAPSLLLRFEQESPPDIFADSSGFLNNATCSLAASQCPIRDPQGRYRSALDFDGVNDTLRISDTLNIGPELTLAAWVNPDTIPASGFQRFITLGSEKAVLRIENQQLHFYMKINGILHHILAPGLLVTGEYQHVAGAYDGQTMRLYYNGTQVGTRSITGTVDNSAGVDINAAGESFDGRMDEVAIFAYALSTAEIGDLMSGRYNANDFLVAPGALLDYQATISNTHPLQTADGFMLGESRYLDPGIVEPEWIFNFEEEDFAMTVSNSNGESSTLNCIGDGSCPTSAAGGIGPGLQFDGINDALNLETLGYDMGSTTMAFWLQVDTLPTGSNRAQIMQTGTTAGSLNVYLDSSGYLWFEMVGAVPNIRQSDCTTIDHFTFFEDQCNVFDNTWSQPHRSDHQFTSNDGFHHIIWSVGKLYIDKILDSWILYTSKPPIFVGPGTVGNNTTRTAPLGATIDELVFYNNDGNWSIEESNVNRIHDVYNGSYKPGFGTAFGESIPSYLYQFNEFYQFPIGGLSVSNQAGTPLTCDSAATCPQYIANGQSGQAMQWDGVDDYLVLPTGSTQNTQNVQMWIKPDTLPPNGQKMVLFSTDTSQTGGAGSRIVLETSAGGFSFIRVERLNPGSTGSTIGGSIDLAAGVWTHIEVRFYNAFADHFMDILINGDGEDPPQPLFFNETHSTTAGPGRLGNSIDGTLPFDGVIDGFVATDYDVSFDPPISPDAGWRNAVSGGRAALCETLRLCPDTTNSGQIGDAIQLDGVQDYLNVADADFVKGDYTLSAWFNTTSISVGTILGATDPVSGHPGVLLEVLANGSVRWTDRWPAAASGGSTVTSGSGYNNGVWHHVVAIKENGVMTLLVDGVATTGSTSGSATAAFEMEIGRDGASNYFSGKLDEMMILPAPATQDKFSAVPALANTLWPGIEFNDPVTGFSLPAQTGLTINGSAQVVPNAANSAHLFEQDVSVVLQPQTPFMTPIVDPYFASLVEYYPFDEPTSACADGVHCPELGNRGILGRGILYDGVDDFGIAGLTNVASGFYTNTDTTTLSVWVKADRGTILSGPLHLNVGSLELNLLCDTAGTGVISFGRVDYILPFDMPEGEWTHLVAVLDNAYNSPNHGRASVYVNGQLAATTMTCLNSLDVLPSHGSQDGFWFNTEIFGSNLFGGDPLNGMLDEYRRYSQALTQVEIQTLSAETVPVLRFEFDEGQNATFYQDGSPNGLVGQPSTFACYQVALDTLSITSLALDPSDLLLELGGSVLGSLDDVTLGSHPLGQGKLLCGPETLEISAVVSGTATSLGTGAINPANSGGTINFTGMSLSWIGGGAPTTVYNPAPGTDGKIGNTALYDGNGHVAVADAVAVTGLTSGFTIMAWVMADENPGQTLQILNTGDEHDNSGFGLALLDGELVFRHSNGVIQTLTTPVNDNIWQHVGVTFDGVDQVVFYHQGGPVYTATLSATLTVDTLKPLLIGASLNDGAVEDRFDGQLDEVAVFGRVLTGNEMLSIFRRELRWYRDREFTVFTVDSDQPLVQLISSNYQPNRLNQLVVSAVDPSSRVILLDFGIWNSGTASYDWQGAPLCRESVRNGTNAAWCVNFDPTLLGGEGAYDVAFRAVDAAGNETTLLQTIFVDATPPTVTVNASGQFRPLDPQPDDGLGWTVAVSGTVMDPMIAGNPGSGVLEHTQNNTRTLEVTLYDADGEVAGNGPQTTQIMSGAWQIDYAFSGRRPRGAFTVHVMATDNVGNQTAPFNPGAPDPDVLLLDASPPAVEFHSWAVPTAISDSVVLSGTISEAPDLGGAVSQFHFEEKGSPFFDFSYQNGPASCGGTGCPTAAAGVFGQSLNFDGSDDSVAFPNVIDPAETHFSASIWFYLSAAPGAAPMRILAQESGGQTGFPWLSVVNNPTPKLQTELGAVFLAGSTTLNVGQWYHAALIYDGVILSLYLDGTLEASAPSTVAANSGRHVIGYDPATQAEFFDGLIDELVLFNRAISKGEVFALAQSQAVGVRDAHIRFAPIVPYSVGINDILSDTMDSSGIWHSITLDNPGASLTQWSYTLPYSPTMEGLFEISLRASDQFSNTTKPSIVWRGAIDMARPRIAFTVNYLGGGSAAATEYVFTVEDYLLDSASLSHPCVPDLTLVPIIDPVSGQTLGLGGACRLPGFATGTVAVEACDLMGNCEKVEQVLTGSTDTPGIVIFDPQPNEVIGFTAGENIPISGGALATSDILDITISDQNGPIEVLPYGPGITDTTWAATTWTPVATGTYTLTASLNQTAGAALTDTIQVTLLANTCFADYDGDNVTDFASLDSSALEAAIDAAPAFGTVRLAGTCPGVQFTGGQTQTAYINRQLTIEGGYDPTDWAAGPDPVANPTTLDAQGAGRVVYIDSLGILTLKNVSVVNGTADFGAGVFVNGTLFLEDSRIVSNSAEQDGGGIYILDAADQAVIQRSEISGNTAFQGGGIYNRGALVVDNSTMSDNTALFAGAGLFISNDGTAALEFVTLYGNSGAGVENLGTLTLFGSVLAGNSADCVNYNTVSDSGFNHVQDGSCSFPAAGDPLLGILADNGGPSLSHRPLAFSLLIDGVPAPQCLTAPTDQRGVVRPFDADCDIGAVELGLNLPPIAVSDTYTTNESTLLQVPAPGVLANDSDGDADSLSSVLLTTTVSGTLVLGPDGGFSYDPLSGICGTDQFTYFAQDDDALKTLTTTVTIDVICLPPVANPGGPYAVNEGSAISLTTSGALQTFEWDFDYDGSFTADASGASVTFDASSLDGPLSRTIALRSTDQTNLTDVATTTVNVLNVAPTANLTGTGTVNEGSTYQLFFSNLIDPGDDSITTCSIDWGDGAVEDCIEAFGSFFFHDYDDGPLMATITIDLIDEDGAHLDAASHLVSVLNVDPLIDFVGNSGPIDEGSTVNVIVFAFDAAGVLDPLGFEFDCDNDFIYEIGPQSGDTAACSFAEDGTYPVNVRVTDGDGGVATGSGNVLVDNIAAEISDVTLSPAIVEGDSATFAGTISDPGLLDTFSLVVDWGDGSVVSYTYPAGTSAISETHSYLDDNPTGTAADVYTVDYSLRDDDAGINGGSTSITVNNAAPSLTPGQDQVVFENSVLNLSLAISDAGVLDTHTATIDWGDGSGVEPATVMSGTVIGSHPYPIFGTYGITVTLTDDDTGVGTDSITLYVVHGFLESCVYSNLNSVKLEKRSMTNCNVAGLGDVSLLDETVVGGDILASGNITLSHQAQVSGDVTAAGTVVQDPTAIVNGTVTSGDSISAVTQISGLSLTAGGGDVTVNKNATSFLAPGVYNVLVIKKNGTLVLSDGAYAFHSVKVQSGGTIQLNISGPGTVIEVVDFVMFQKDTQIALSGGTAADLLWVVGGTLVSMGKDGSFAGTFIAPNASFAISQGAAVTGALYGQLVVLKADSLVTYEPALGLFVNYFVP